jgi:hypothetical protein
MDTIVAATMTDPVSVVNGLALAAALLVALAFRGPRPRS